MIGISAVTVALAKDKISNALRAANFGTDESTLKNKIGFETIRVRQDNQETSELAIEAIKKLLHTDPKILEKIECLIVVTQNPDGYGLPHTAAVIHGELGLPTSCAAFDISLGCSGYVYGLSVITNFMQGNGMKTGLLVTADPYSKILDREDKNTALLFGDGATATLMTDAPTWRIGNFDFGSDGTLRSALAVGEDRHLRMNGRAVFNFSVLNVPESIRKCAQINKLDLNAIDRFVLHQGSRYIIDNIAKRLKIEDKTAFYAAEYGNLVSSSIPAILANDLSMNDKTILISGFGVGLSWATTVLMHTEV